MVYDEDEEAWFCDMDMDEDDAVRLLTGHYRQCPYYQSDNEYEVVAKQAK